jgi:DNA-binding HxlR family transcriptional regulator
MKKYKINKIVYSCPLLLVESIIMGKWKGMIIWALLEHKVLRYGQLKKGIDLMQKVSDKMLIQSLKELERDGIIIKKIFNVSPPKVEYSLSEIGLKLKPIWKSLWKFGELYEI